MSWTITPQTKVPVDPQYGSVSLLLHGNGTNGSTTITDNSPSPKTVTAVGNAQISTAQSKFGGSSIAFDGTGDYIETSGTNASLEMGSGSWTIEMWVYQIARTTVGSGASLYDSLALSSSTTNATRLRISPSGELLFVRYSTAVFTSTAVVPLTTWSHVAMVKNESTLNFYLGGASAGSIADTITYTNGLNRPIIGTDGFSPGSSNLNGYIDDLRITKGIARYTANFTPPAAPFPDI
jgi:hypothetical protein